MTNIKLYALLYLKERIESHIKHLKQISLETHPSEYQQVRKTRLEKQLREYEIEYELINK